MYLSHRGKRMNYCTRPFSGRVLRIWVHLVCCTRERGLYGLVSFRGYLDG